MIDQREWLSLIAKTSQEECRELGAMFLSMADAPRDAHWQAQFAEKLATMPEPPEFDRARVIADARARVLAAEDARRA